MSKRVAILSGGGDVPGLNLCLKSLVYRVIDLGFEPIGVRKGWEGLINYNPQDPSTYSDFFIELTKNLVRPIDRTPGSFLHSSRLDPRRVPAGMVPAFLRSSQSDSQDLTGHLKDVIQRLGYRALIVIGDDDTLHYAAHLSQQGVPVIGIPKTIHNNICGTDYTLGFSTGLSRGVTFIHELRALAGSREQVIVVETFAAKSGYSTLLMGFLGGADRVVIPEVPYDPKKLGPLILQDKRQSPASYAVMVICDGSTIAEEAAGAYAHLFPAGRAGQRVGGERGIGEGSLVGSGMVAARTLESVIGEDVFLQPLTYLLRTGSPDGQDLLGAANCALTAARLLEEERYGRMAAFVQHDMWTDIDLRQAAGGIKTVDVAAWYEVNSYKPKLSIIWSVEGG
jgi:ATP-dependent phosphofructokinase / diphosphate-dependent phosphofructokinase